MSGRAPLPPPPMGSAPPPPRTSLAPSSVSAGSARTVWVPHDADVWALAEVVRESYDSLRVSVLNAKRKEEKDVLKTACCEINPSVVEDMSSLHHLHEPGILHNLKERFLTKQIYTCMGAAMIAVNPLQRIAQPAMQDYAKPGKTTAPHPYAIAENAYRNLNVLKKNQSIVISGESGSGKTETAKIIVKYLADRNLSTADGATTTGDQLYEQLQGLSPILESFGNAKTTRNNNSSRFGKFMKLNFELVAKAAGAAGKSTKNAYRMELRGSLIETYLLEKSRVVHQNGSEQNFHIFYSLLRHPPRALQRFLKSADNTHALHFRIARKPLNNGTEFFLDEEHELQSVEKAFHVLGLDGAAVEQIWRILVALLHLGNVVFEQVDSPQGPVSRVSQRVAEKDDLVHGENAGWSAERHLQSAAELLCLDVQELNVLFTQRHVETRGETFNVPLSVRESKFACDAANKVIYESLFAYIVRVMNSVIDKSHCEDEEEEEDESKRHFIGVLDIFGFETFDKNGFEQLLINFANEALQNTFNNQIFARERQLFEEEKIEMKIGECPSNLDCVNLINLKGESIFGKLDSISRQPNPSDGRFCEELHKAFTKKNKYFGAVHRKDMAHLFVVNHYAAPVAYTVGDPQTKGASAAAESTDNAWISKNNDSIPDGLENLYYASELHQFQQLSAAASSGAPIAQGKNKPTDAKRRKSVMMKPTIVEVFSKSMRDLNFVLDSTNCHFIRCIKPNAAMRAGEFDTRYVVEQVRALGILQACEVLSVGLPTRIPYSELKNALESTIQRVQRLLGGSGGGADSDVLLISALLKAYDIPAESYRLGVSIAFFRPGQLATLEQIFNQDLLPDREAEIVQTVERSVHQYQRVLGEIGNSRAQLTIATELTAELEARQDRLRDNASALPENRGLDIPNDVARQIAQVEQLADRLRAQHNDVVKQKLNVERLLAQHRVDLEDANTAKVLDTHAVALFFQLFDAIDAQVDRVAAGQQEIQRAVAELEDAQSTTAQTGELHRIVQRNDALYEQIMDGVAKAEELLQEVTIFAERGNVDAAYACFETMNAELAAINARSGELSSLLQTASEIMRNIEDSLANVSFDGVKELLAATIDRFADVQDTAAQYSSVLQSFFSQLENYSPYVEEVVEIAAEPETTTQSETATAEPAERRQSLSAKVRSMSIKTSDAAAASTASIAKRKSSIGSLVSTETASSLESAADISKPALPPNWKELFDPKSGRAYYVNRVTKERQWKRPVAEGSSSTSSETVKSSATKSSKRVVLETVAENATSAAPTKAPRPPPRPKDLSASAAALPAGWREVLDKKSGRTFYVNDVTKQRQWRRPDPESERPMSVRETAIENIDRRASRRISTRITPLSGSALSPDKAKQRALEEEQRAIREMFNVVDLVVESVTRSRRVSAMIMSEELLSDAELDDGAKETVSYMMRIGHRDHAGYLMKQSKLLGRWRKRYFSLQNQTLAYFDSEKDCMHRSTGAKSSSKAEKVFQLRGSSQTSYTTTEHCVSISNPNEDEDEETAWYLLADNESSCDEWMRFLNAHIHVQFLKENNLQGRDFWEEGSVTVSIWKVPHSPVSGAQRRPVGIRTLPMVNGPRTGEGLYPGDVVEIVQSIKQDGRDKQQTYLRLSNDRGWVFEMHPTADYAIMVPAGGEVKEAVLRYSYSADFLENLQIFSTPHCHPDSAVGSVESGIMDSSISPGAIVEGCAQWDILSTQLYPSGESEFDDDEPFKLSFIKLRDGRGWVPVYHPVTGGQLLIPADNKPKK